MTVKTVKKPAQDGVKKSLKLGKDVDVKRHTETAFKGAPARPGSKPAPKK